MQVARRAAARPKGEETNDWRLIQVADSSSYLQGAEDISRGKYHLFLVTSRYN